MDTKTLLLIAQVARNKAWTNCQRVYTLKRKMPEIILNNRLKTTAGRCFLDKRLIDLSTDLFTENVQEFELTIIPHEVAHMVAFDVFKDEGHGAGWKKVMRALDLEPARCHD